MPTTKLGEYLVVARKGVLINLGEAVNVSLWPGSVWVKVPGTQLETSFEMTQETKDGIPLRFKGGVVYRITRPEVTAGRFDFTHNGERDLGRLIAQCCLAELRDQVSHLTMAECIEQRKTTLTQAVGSAVANLVGQPGAEWGLSVEVVQVSQVYIVDAELRTQLEAETRGAIRTTSERALLQAAQEVQLATIAAERRLGDEALETETRKTQLEAQKLALAASVERRRAEEALETAKQAAEWEAQRLEAEAPVARRRHELRLQTLHEEDEALDRELALTQKRVEVDFAVRRAEHQLLMERLPVEQRPQIAQAASTLLQGAKLSVYGEDSRFMGALEPLLEMVGSALRGE